MRVDVWTGMPSGVAAMFAIMLTAAVTLGASGSATSIAGIAMMSFPIAALLKS